MKEEPAAHHLKIAQTAHHPARVAGGRRGLLPRPARLQLQLVERELIEREQAQDQIRPLPSSRPSTLSKLDRQALVRGQNSCAGNISCTKTCSFSVTPAPVRRTWPPPWAAACAQGRRVRPPWLPICSNSVTSRLQRFIKQLERLFARTSTNSANSPRPVPKDVVSRAYERTTSSSQPICLSELDRGAGLRTAPRRSLGFTHRVHILEAICVPAAATGVQKNKFLGPARRPPTSSPGPGHPPKPKT